MRQQMRMLRAKVALREPFMPESISHDQSIATSQHGHADASNVETLRWRADALELLDQRALPSRVQYLRLENAAAVAAAISDMVVRGAPAIGVSAAYAAVMAGRDRFVALGQGWRTAFEADLATLARARPTAVNLGWALERMRACVQGADGDPTAILLAQALAIHAEDLDANRRMGDLGADLITGPCSVLTHCNAGALATAGYGTALGVIRSAFRDGKIVQVYAGETRPWMQGARLTAFELTADAIPVKLIADSAASYALHQGAIKWIIVGADRVAANGDVANKIGTYSLAVSARHHGVGFMVVAPLSTIDRNCESGAQIPSRNAGLMKFSNSAANVLPLPVRKPGILCSTSRRPTWWMCW